MSDELLPFYNRELSFIRRLGAEFARTHPKIAGRLRLGADTSEDPHVERLIQAFAYLNARVRHKLEDDFPEITDALLGVLYPHYQLPVPSMAIVQLDLDPNQSELTSGAPVPADTLLETETIEGEPCRFRTCYPVTLWPIDVRLASLTPRPFQAPPVPFADRAAAVLRLVLTGRSEAIPFSALALASLRFYLKGQGQHVYPLYELLFNNVLGVVLAGSPDDHGAVLLEKDCVRPVGFSREEGLLPYPPRSFLGYRLLTEFFAFPEKFLFFDLGGWDRAQLAHLGNRLEVYLYLNRGGADLEHYLSADMFRTGCTPIVNLYRQRAEPIALTQNQWEYRVVPDARRPLAHEVYTIDRATALSPEGESVEYAPFFSTKHASPHETRFWHATRRPAVPPDAAGPPGGQTDLGTEVFVSLVDPEFRVSAPANWSLDVETTCLNRDLPHRLPFGGDQPRLQISEGGTLVGRVACLTPPTRTLRPALRKGAMWRLMSHLTLNHLSLVDHRAGAEALREILTLYDFTHSEETRAMIAGITDVESRRVVGRVRTEGGASSAVCRGVEVTVRFDEKRFAGSGLFLFASVLEHFIALYCTINSFSRLTATVEGRKGELCRWPPRMGEKVLL
jgi:type VI secretion system protein ImpG